MTIRRLISILIYILSGAVGILAFIYPFFTPIGQQGGSMVAHSQDAPLLTVGLVALSVVALLVELQGQAISAKMVAMLGVLVAVTSALRFLEVAFPVPGGFSAVFAPILLAGYVFGGRFGYLMGVFTLLISALVTGGVGPWLPYQMFTAGWTGLTAGWLSRALPRGRRTNRSTARPGRHLTLEIVLLAAFGFVWGLLYGAIMNVYFWPFAVGSPEQTWNAGLSLGQIIARYGVFYATTSLAWDLVRAVGNVALILLLGAPMLHALVRFQRRFQFEAHTHA
ncbi:MAG: ECF transporter S component [Anaerolineae bacterium]|jgi:energy-coupling factor transport system substrate-specific component